MNLITNKYYLVILDDIWNELKNNINYVKNRTIVDD